MTAPPALPSAARARATLALLGAAWSGVLLGLVVGSPPTGAERSSQPEAPGDHGAADERVAPRAPVPPAIDPAAEPPARPALVEAARAALRGLRLSPWRTPDGREVQGAAASAPLVWAALTPGPVETAASLDRDAPASTADRRYVTLVRVLAGSVRARIVPPVAAVEDGSGGAPGGPLAGLDPHRLLAAIDLGAPATWRADGHRAGLPPDPARTALWVQGGRPRVGLPPPAAQALVQGAGGGDAAANAVVIATDPAGALLIVCGQAVAPAALAGLAARLGASDVATFPGAAGSRPQEGAGDLYFWAGGSDDARLYRRPLGRDGRPQPARALGLDRPKLLLSLAPSPGRTLQDTR